MLVATVNRKEPLERLLDSLCRQTLPADSFEVLLADQNEEGFLQPVLDAFSSALSIQVVRVPNKGVSQARNALLPYVRGEYVAFPDDDCFYEEDTLEKVKSFFEGHAAAHVIQGSWSDPADARQECPGEGGGQCTQADWSSVFRRGGSLVQFFRREAVERIGPYDTVLGPGNGLPYGCGEDTDYLLRALEAGLCVMHVPAVHVRHKEADLSLSGNGLQKVQSYAAGRMYLLHKHRLPLWFQLVMIAYPLLRIPLEGGKAVRYRLAMFSARLKGFFLVRRVKCLAE